MCLGKEVNILATFIISRCLEKVVIAPVREFDQLLWFCLLCMFLVQTAFTLMEKKKKERKEERKKETWTPFCKFPLGQGKAYN